MISKKELNYVSSYARFAPYPGDEYAQNVLKRLSDAYEKYQEKYMNKNYSMIFSNGEELEFEIFPKNMCHLLGLDFTNISGPYMEKTCKDILGLNPTDKKDSFTILTKIVENADKVIENDSKVESNKILNYYKVMIRSIAFSKLSEFDKFNYGCINFNVEEFNKISEHSTNIQSRKFLFTPSNEAITPYFMMGINEDDESNAYYPETLIAPTNYIDFFKYQTLLLPIQVLVSDDNSLAKIVATPEEKITLLNMYKSIILSNNTNSNIDIYNDYESILRERK